MASPRPGAPRPAATQPPIAIPEGAHACSAEPLPTTREEARTRGWNELDIVFVTGDAYLDHPSFAMAILGRVLEANGFRVAILPQPDWRDCSAWREFGRPRLFFAISAGNMDSMINHYTANKKVRNDDAYSPGGRIGLRPDRATLAYCQRAREAYRGVPIVAGGVEASLRRLAHYDYWSDSVRRSILLDAKADLLGFGMGESCIVEIAQRLDAGQSIRDLRDLRGVAYAVGASEEPPCGDDVLEIPSFEEVRDDAQAFARATRIIHLETNPYNARAIRQRHGSQWVVCNPPRLPESTAALDFFHGLPYSRKPHPRYREPIPAFTVIRDSVQILRGCFGGCTYCSITAHQGRIIQQRSRDSVLAEIASMATAPEFRGTVSDIGGPSANMYGMGCSRPEIEARCRRLSCVYPKVCPLLDTDHGELIELMRDSRHQSGVKKVLVASGVRMDLAHRSPEYVEELARHHVGGHLKVAQEHSDGDTLRLMKRPKVDNFRRFDRLFRKQSKAAGKRQSLIPYFISAHPGSDVAAMIDLAVFLKRSGYEPDQVQDFIPAPFDIATCMYHTGIDPLSMRPVSVAKGLRERRVQRALLQFFKPENYFAVRKALIEHGRRDLIGVGPDSLIPAQPPPEAIAARRREASRSARGAPRRTGGAGGQAPEKREGSTDAGYRPGRRSATRRQRKRRRGS